MASRGLPSVQCCGFHWECLCDTTACQSHGVFVVGPLMSARLHWIQSPEATDSTSLRGNEDAVPNTFLRWSGGLLGLFQRLEPQLVEGQNCTGSTRLGRALELPCLRLVR